MRHRPARVRQILFNLTSNAVKFGAGRPVRLRCAGRDGEVVFDVIDGGPGIPAGQHDRIFEEYVRLDAATTGTGLGLAIARRLAELLGGAVGVAASSSDGSTFRLTLPAEGPVPKTGAPGATPDSRAD